MFRWSDLLDLAEELVQRSGDEAAERTAISRAYHAAFGTARRRLDPTGARIPETSHSHAIVWTTFHATPDRDHRRIADRGRRLRQWRIKADYVDVVPDLSATAQTAVSLARRVLTDLANLP